MRSQGRCARPAEMKSSAVQQGTVIGGGNALIFPEGPVDGQGRGITDEIADFLQGRIRPLRHDLFGKAEPLPVDIIQQVFPRGFLKPLGEVGRTHVKMIGNDGDGKGRIGDVGVDIIHKLQVLRAGGQVFFL